MENTDISVPYMRNMYVPDMENSSVPGTETSLVRPPNTDLENNLKFNPTSGSTPVVFRNRNRKTLENCQQHCAKAPDSRYQAEAADQTTNSSIGLEVARGGVSKHGLLFGDDVEHQYGAKSNVY